MLADPAEWDRDPWSGDLVDGEVWGRGALDMKGQVAASAVAFASLKREGFEPSGDLVFLTVADEEVGEGVGWGLDWLVEAHPEAARCDYAVNEGGGERLVLGGKPVYLCATAEKMSAPFKLRVHGRSGHASMPGIADNALVKAARYVEALGAYEPPREMIPEARGFLEAVLGEAPPLEEALARAGRAEPAAARARRAASLADAVADDDRRVAPAERDPRAVRGDGRLPAAPRADARGRGAADPRRARERELRARVDRGDRRDALPSWTRRSGTRSPSFVEGIEPGARMAPIACPGFTDSHYLREAYGTVAYGFFPIKAMDTELATKLVHSANERIAVDDLELGVDMLRATAKTLLA